MNGVAFSLCGQSMIARQSGALWWPGPRVLCVSDLHLGKSERIARRGGTLLPPYETRDTLARLTAEITALDPQTVVSLGDSFDDLTAAQTLTAQDAAALHSLTATRNWVWISGNHDAGPLPLGGTTAAEWTLEGLVFRHIADPGSEAEVSGHFHPKMRLGGRARACFLHDSHRLILPAFGTYTGGLYADDPAFAALMGAKTCAILTGRTMVTAPVTYAKP